MPTARRFPPWIRSSLPVGDKHDAVRAVLSELSLNTVCRSAQCPNCSECWHRGTATFMVMGSVCTRNCAFCGVNAGRPGPLEADEPRRIAEAVSRLRLRHTVITSVTRDDLPDGGAAHFAAVVRAVHTHCPGVTVEVLTSDFGGLRASVAKVCEARPEVFAHNIETIPRLHGLLRDPRASYARSLDVLQLARQTLPGACHVKSGLMVGCGETEAEVFDTLADLRKAGCDAVTIGQYLKPGGSRLEISRFIAPGRFAAFESHARSLGFSFTKAGPLVRSSYHAEAIFDKDTARTVGDGLSLHPTNLA